MKKGLHPDNYRLVVFKDMSNGTTFLSRSTANTKETLKWEDGNEYPLVKLEISSTSHPFFTGKNMLVDTAGRIDKFKKKYAKKAESYYIVQRLLLCNELFFMAILYNLLIHREVLFLRYPCLPHPIFPYFWPLLIWIPSSSPKSLRTRKTFFHSALPGRCRISA